MAAPALDAAADEVAEGVTCKTNGCATGLNTGSLSLGQATGTVRLVRQGVHDFESVSFFEAQRSPAGPPARLCVYA